MKDEDAQPTPPVAPDDPPPVKPAEEGATLSDGTKLPPISDEKWADFERSLPRNYRDKRD